MCADAVRNVSNLVKEQSFSTEVPQERALLVGIDRGSTEWQLEQSLEELARLVETDGAVVVGMVSQRLKNPNARTFIGTGKVEEVVNAAAAFENAASSSLP